MRIGILGSGLMGGKLGTLFARAGHDVVFSYARSEQKLKELARQAQGNARAGTPGEAAHEADALLSSPRSARCPARCCSACSSQGGKPTGPASRTVATTKTRGRS
jgi:hypothetical protein